MSVPDPLLRCPGPSARRQQWERNASQREQAIQQLRSYLDEPACVSGVDANVLGYYPHLDELGEAFVALLRLELGTHTDLIESLRSMRSIAAVLGEYWRFVYQVGDRHPQMRFVSSHIRAFLNKAGPLPLDPDPRVTHAELITQAFTKAYTETRLALDKNDALSVQHHVVIMIDYINEMLNLLQYLKFRGDEELTEYELAAAHQ